MAIHPFTDIYRVRPTATSWKVPVFCNNDWVGIQLLDMVKEIGGGRAFDIAYGVPMCAWAGGRPSAIRQPLSEKELHRYFAAYADRDVTVALTMSRLDVQSSQLSDPYCNLILKVANQYNAQAIVVVDELADYIREQYPNIALIASLDKVMCELRTDYSVELDYYRKLLERYDEIVIRCEAALSNDLILPLQDVADRMEIIVNQACMPDCQFCHLHIASMEALNDPSKPAKQPYDCFYHSDAHDFETRIERSLMISESRISWLANHGFTKMKIAGRNVPIPHLLNQLGMYIFEPTGVFRAVRTELSQRYRDANEKAGGKIPPYALPTGL